MISLCVPYHKTSKTAFFLARLLTSIQEQTYTDYEIILTAKGLMAENHNAAIREAKGDIIKILDMDDYLAHPDALKNMVQEFEREPEKQWLISANNHFDGERTGYPHFPEWNHQIFTGRNTLGSLSTLAMKRTDLLFDEELHWVVDVDFYWRMYQKYGQPILSKDIDVTVSWHPEQTTNLLSEEVKNREHQIMQERYGK